MYIFKTFGKSKRLCSIVYIVYALYALTNRANMFIVWFGGGHRLTVVKI